MFTILLNHCGEKNSQALCKLLEYNGGAVYISTTSVLNNSIFSPEFLLINIDSIKNVGTDKIIIINSHKNNDIKFSELIISIGCEQKITLSMNINSEISVSSISEEMVCLSIQSEIFTLQNNKISPGEVTIKKDKKENLLVCLMKFAVLLLCDKIDTRKEKLSL